MNTPSGGPAFPGTYTARSDQGRGPVTEFHDKGMSLRDYLAAKAMQGFNANPHYDEYSHEDMAALCYMAADAMLAARSA